MRRGEPVLVVLCGGRGTRAHPLTEELPKPLLTVAGRPLLAHLIDIYAVHEVHDVVLAAGFRADLISEFARGTRPPTRVRVVNTGEDTGTGARIRCCLDHVGPTFLATYGDGLGRVDITAALAFHRSHGRGATVTGVALPSQYATLELGPQDRVVGVREKPVLTDYRINAGFFVFDRDVYAATRGDDLERNVLPTLAAAGQLAMFRHDGFWKSMDTFKDRAELELLAAQEVPPWLG